MPKEENDTEPVFIELAYDLSIPLIATNDVYFDNIEMYEAHDAYFYVSLTVLTLISRSLAEL